jgi:hypothetical protein
VSASWKRGTATCVPCLCGEVCCRRSMCLEGCIAFVLLQGAGMSCERSVVRETA